MTLKKRTKNILLSMVIIFALILSSICYLYFPRYFVKLLPDEQIISVQKRTYDNANGHEILVNLTEEEIIVFCSLIKDFKYVKHYNFLQRRAQRWDLRDYIITYENCTISFCRYSFFLFNANDNTSTSLQFVDQYPSDNYVQLDLLFDN